MSTKLLDKPISGERVWEKVTANEPLHPDHWW